MKVDNKVLDTLFRYLNSIDYNESLDAEVKKKDQQPSDRLVIVSIIMARIIIGCPDVTFSKAAHVFMSKFYLSKHTKVNEIISNAYSYIKNSSDESNTKDKSNHNKNNDDDTENLYL